MRANRTTRRLLLALLAIVAIATVADAGSSGPTRPMSPLLVRERHVFFDPVVAPALAAAPDAHRRAGDVPVSVAVPSVGIAAKVVPVGTMANGAMRVTEEPDIADWSTATAYPGDQGSAVIAGHAGFATGKAAFDPLVNVRVGDVVRVGGKNGGRTTFKVTALRRYPADADMPWVFERSDGSYLNLICCTGEWDASAGTHSERLIVFTRLVQ